MTASTERRSARRGVKALCLVAVLLGVLSVAAPASAAPTFGVALTDDANEVQVVYVNATAGQFRLSFGANTTPDLSATATSGAVESALNALPSISANGGSISVEPGTSAGTEGGIGTSGGAEYVVSFDGGPLAHTEVAKLTVVSGATPLTGLAGRAMAFVLDPAGVNRSDRRVDYTVSVQNSGSSTLVTGDTLSCDRGEWFPLDGNPAYAYRWLRNGTPIPGAAAGTYSLTALDSGKAIQCQVTGTNSIADQTDPSDFAGHTTVSGAMVILPDPVTPPPIGPRTIEAPASTGPLDHSATQELTCEAGAWQNSPAEYLYRWYRNGVEFGSPVGPTAATSAKLTLTAAEQSPPSQFQCSVTGINAGGATESASFNLNSTNPENVPPIDSLNDSRIVGPGDASGETTVKVELPGGEGTFVRGASGSGWTCINAAASGVQPATATCTTTEFVPAGAAYPGIEVIAGLGADAPDHAVAIATVSGGGSVGSVADSDEFDIAPARWFEISTLEAQVSNLDGTEYTQAGGHPFAASSSFEFPRYRNLSEGGNVNATANFRYDPLENVKTVITNLPRGFVGNALAAPELCPGLAQVLAGTCPPRSVVGGITLDIQGFGNGVGPLAIYAIEPEYGVPAQFGFAEGQSRTVYTISPSLRADDGYAITLEATPVPTSFPLFYGVQNVTLCSFGAKTIELVNSTLGLGGCKQASDPGANQLPLITNPTRCTGQPPTLNLQVNTWQHPDRFLSKDAVNPLPTGCDKISFQPKIELRPTSHQADSPTGMDVEIAMPTDGLEDPQGLAQANLDNATVIFPKGMSVNPAASQGLGACTPAEVKLGSNDDVECPLSSKIGTVEVETPLIQETLTGDVYLASQRNNPFNSTVGLYLVFASKKDGITIKVAGKVVPDPVTGQLTSVFTENPEAPFSRLSLHLNSGPRAPLVNPPRCGSYAIHSELSPWSAADPGNPTPSEIVASDSTYEVTSGPNGGPCPSGALDPKLEAGLKNPRAGATSPFVLKLSRDDGSQRFTGLDLAMPTGLTAYLKGVPYCPANVLAGISTAELTGRPELATPACPAASQVGTVEAGAGAGPNPFYAPGRVYLAGPYKGAPLSLAIVTPAVAGPFDLGNVTVRSALYVNPVTAQVTVKSDPIPTIVHGILIDLREIRVNINRPGFTAAPTSCEPKTIGARVEGEGGAVASLSKRLQVGGCEALRFKPKLKLSLKGGAKRNRYPALKAVLTQRPGEANISSVSVALPHSEFLEQNHIKTICTRVQFNAVPRACPAKSIYGHAEAESPLLGYPLSGPVYLRSSDHKLPDLVAALKGPDSQPIEIDLAGRIDGVHGGIRNSFEIVPDAPVSRFVLRMQGGKKGLLVNSRDLCKTVNRATVDFTGQNGKLQRLRPKLTSSCKGRGAKKHRHHGKKHRHHR